jgi:hypothetical protein
MFKAGQKVVCINDEQGIVSKQKLLKKDAIYIVEQGLINDVFLVGIFGGWSNSRFRPLDENFAEETLAKIAEQIKEEQLVTI